MEFDITKIIIVLVVVFFSMTLHEVMHGLVSFWLGDDTAKLQGRLTLNPIKHVDPFLTIILPVLLAITPGAPIFGGAKPVQFNPNRVKYDEWGVALVAISGPLTNLVLAFVGFSVTMFLRGDSVVSDFFSLFVLVNLGFFAFNIIPFPPLDGSRVLYALAPEFVRRGMDIIEPYSIFLVFIIVIFANSAIGSFMLTVIRGILDLFLHIYGVA